MKNLKWSKIENPLEDITKKIKNDIINIEGKINLKIQNEIDLFEEKINLKIQNDIIILQNETINKIV